MRYECVFVCTCVVICSAVVSYRTLQWGWGGWGRPGASNSSSPASVLPSPCKILLTWHCDTVQLETCEHGSPQTFSQFLHRFRHSPVMFSPCSHGSGSLTRIWIWSWIVSSLSDFVCYRFLCSLLWFPQLCPRVCLCPVSVVSLVFQSVMSRWLFPFCLRQVQSQSLTVCDVSCFVLSLFLVYCLVLCPLSVVFPAAYHFLITLHVEPLS